jgi:dephospho-CoA kinase
MLKIGLTGGIGTGKTYLSTHFRDMGVPVYYADDEAKKLYRQHDFFGGNA